MGDRNEYFHLEPQDKYNSSVVKINQVTMAQSFMTDLFQVGQLHFFYSETEYEKKEQSCGLWNTICLYIVIRNLLIIY